MEMIELFVFLMQKEKTTCKEIANRFEFSVRTACRKVEKMSLAVPIVTIQGFGGGVYILPEYKKEFIKQISKLIL
jgi:predicted DNA-binding transcriptional regulator YafY